MSYLHRENLYTYALVRPKWNLTFVTIKRVVKLTVLQTVMQVCLTPAGRNRYLNSDRASDKLMTGAMPT